MDAHQMAWNKKVACQVIDQLEKRNMQGSYAPTAVQAKDEILAMIPQGSTVFRCGCTTATNMGLWEDITKLPGVELIDPYRDGISREESITLRRRGLTADIMIAGCNAVTLDGRLVNLDGVGNKYRSIFQGEGINTLGELVDRFGVSVSYRPVPASGPMARKALLGSPRSTNGMTLPRWPNRPRLTCRLALIPLASKRK